MLANPTDLTLFIRQEEDRLITDSRAVALAFGKMHKDVMRSIRSGLESKRPEIAEHARRNFAPCSYTDTNSRQRSMYQMTADGLAELTMGFSGEDAKVVRIRFIAAFREVSARLENAEKSISQMLHDYERRAVASETKGRMGSQLMHGRRKEKPELLDEQARLLEAVQPSLIQ